MKLIGVMPVRNEAWVLGLSARVALMWCDQIIFADHWSKDGSRDIMNDLASEHGRDRVLIRDDREHEWKEMEQRQMLLETAREEGATHIAIIDADEVLTANLLKINMFGQGALMDKHCGVPRGSILQLPGYNLRGSINRYHNNGIWGKRWFSTAFADDPRLSWSGDKFHSREPQGMPLKPYQAVSQGQGGVMHLWGASERRLRAKSALYKLTERLRWPQKPIAEIERMYNWAIHGEEGNPAFGTPATWTYVDVPAEWWSPYQNLMKYLDVDAEPWQEAEIRRIIKEHGPRMFEGLDLFGLA